ncbi:hypothetical protein SH2C18_05600 [Clostridium sediminicola]|uniref:hypothetical protein n=1 Tax=Clostridium sediminicola TaxID=3114879 RepID=UPI0031F1F75F
MRRNKFVIFSIILLVVAFIGGYFVADFYVRPKEKIIKENSEDSLNVSLNAAKEKILDKVIDSNDEILFTVKCGESENFRVEWKSSSDDLDLAGNTVKDLYEKYKGLGYKINSCSENQIQLTRKSKAYKPNKFVILLDNNNILICKSDKNGNIYDDKGEYIYKEDLGNTGINITINSLKEGDIKMILAGDDAMQLNSLEDAFSRLADYI